MQAPNGWRRSLATEDFFLIAWMIIVDTENALLRVLQAMFFIMV
ncbi:hypothetical protein SBDP1_350003 [Syntrophobacter sp. SbD1]|nr:hypothetical protein SBDP1_350003 [Syntrophobacter sp. SbD1]